MRRVVFIFFIFLRTSSARGRGGREGAARLFLFFSFSCLSDHERDWLPCKVVFFGLATNQRADCEKQQRGNGSGTKILGKRDVSKET